MIYNIDEYNLCIEKTLKNGKYDFLKNKSILITGANGLIASCIVDILNYFNEKMNYNIQIYIMIRNQNRILSRFLNYKKLTVVEQDVINEVRLEKDIDYIIHAASNAHPKVFSEDPVGTMLGNFIGMYNILEFARKNDIEKVVYVSSGEIYGQGEENIESFTEVYNGKININNPRSCYPIGKISAETLCASYTAQYKVKSSIVRPCHIYGPTQTEFDTRAASQFIRDVLENKDIIMKSEGKQIRSYCFVLDCATAILTVLKNGENYNAYNIANKNSIISIRDLAETIAKYSGRKILFEIPTETEKASYNPVTRSVLSEEKLLNLGWKPIWNIEDGINETLKIMVHD